jgi:hypothetical protein
MTSDLTWRFAPTVHGAVESGNLVLLDIARDAYFCVPGAGTSLLPGPVHEGLGELSPEVLRDLAEAGLVRQTVDPPAQAWSTLPPTRDLVSVEGVARDWRDWMAFGEALATLAPSYYRRPFARVVAHARARRAWSRTAAGVLTPEVIDRAARFNAMLPWSPVRGACLLQATWLLEILAQEGFAADWVFGVRTWPFSAHCWVQVGDTVLNDSVERVAPYRAILKV